MANYSTLEHSKTLGKQQMRNFSTLASTLAPNPLKTPDLYRALASRSTWAEVSSFSAVIKIRGCEMVLKHLALLQLGTG